MFLLRRGASLLGIVIHGPLRRGSTMTEFHCESALRHIQRVVAIASSDNAPITLAEALEQIVETLDLAGFGPALRAAAEAAEAPIH
jgi:hypothetical protein